MTVRERVDEWNRKHWVGEEVVVWRDNGEALLTVTRSHAEVLSGHFPVVWVKGIAGCYHLDKVRPVTRVAT